MFYSKSIIKNNNLKNISKTKNRFGQLNNNQHFEFFLFVFVLFYSFIQLSSPDTLWIDSLTTSLHTQIVEFSKCCYYCMHSSVYIYCRAYPTHTYGCKNENRKMLISYFCENYAYYKYGFFVCLLLYYVLLYLFSSCNFWINH